VPGHEGTVGNEKADQLARTGPEHLFTGPEPACGISIGVAKKVVSDWTNRNHKEHWESIIGLRQAKGLILGPSARRTRDLLKLNRDQLRWVVGLFTGHCHLKRHLLKLGLTDDPTWERCLEEDESATTDPMHLGGHSLFKISSPGQFFMEPSDYYDTPINEVLRFVRSVGLIKGESKRETQ
jgi:hypothetical protein